MDTDKRFLFGFISEGFPSVVGHLGVWFYSVGATPRVTHEPITQAYFENSDWSETEHGATCQ